MNRAHASDSIAGFRVILGMWVGRVALGMATWGLVAAGSLVSCLLSFESYRPREDAPGAGAQTSAESGSGAGGHGAGGAGGGSAGSGGCGGGMCPGDVAWALGFGDADMQGGKHAACDADGAVVVAGQYRGKTNPGGGELPYVAGDDVFVAKYDGAGKPLWARPLVGPSDQDVSGVGTAPSGDVIVGGSFLGSITIADGTPLASKGSLDIYLARLKKPDGSLVWGKTFGGSGESPDWLDASAVSSANAIAIAGRYASTQFSLGGATFPNPIGNASGDAFIAVLDGAGALTWNYGLAVDTSFHQVRAVAIDAQGSVVAGGLYSGNVSIAGHALPKATSGNDLFVVKFGPGGAYAWSEAFAGPGDQEIAGVALAPNGEIYLCGSFFESVDFAGNVLVSAGKIDAFVAKLDAGGKPLWSKRFGDDQEQSCHALALAGDGGVVVTGATLGKIDFGGGPLGKANDAYVAELAPDGAHRWSRSFAIADVQGGRGVAVDPKSPRVVFTGNSIGNVDFDGFHLTGAGQTDVFVASMVR